MTPAYRAAALLVLGGGLIALELRLRGEALVGTQVSGQVVAFALFIPAAALCWRGVGIGLAGVALVVLLAVGMRLLRVLYGIRLHDVPPMRAIWRDALTGLSLTEMTYGWPTEMIVKAVGAGLPIAEIAVRCRARRGGTSKIAGRAWPSARAGMRMLAVVVRHA